MNGQLLDWCDSILPALRLGTAPLDIRSFEGTVGELSAALGEWRRPPELALDMLDAGDVTLDAPHARDAQQRVEAKLRDIARAQAPTLLRVSSTHVLAHLYPGGVTQPLNRFLRNGRFAVLLVLPPPAPRTMPPGVVLRDWRAALLQVAPPVGGGHPQSPVGAG